MNILAIHAHPDDVEFLAGGTLALLAPAHRIVSCTFTAGDCGSTQHTPEQIAAIRREEGRVAAALLGAEYICLEERDLQIELSNALRRKVVETLRAVQAEVVITASPHDYMIDHETASLVVRDACFAAPVPNYPTGAASPAPPLAKVPYLYYADPVELTDNLGETVMPHFVVDVHDVIETKIALAACHASQREWLRAHHGMDAYIETMKQWSARRGALCGTPYAEGFRQHRGHAYPRDNVLAALLGSRVKDLSHG